MKHRWCIGCCLLQNLFSFLTLDVWYYLICVRHCSLLCALHSQPRVSSLPVFRILKTGTMLVSTRPNPPVCWNCTETTTSTLCRSMQCVMLQQTLLMHWWSWVEFEFIFMNCALCLDGWNVLFSVQVENEHLIKELENEVACLKEEKKEFELALKSLRLDSELNQIINFTYV